MQNDNLKLKIKKFKQLSLRVLPKHRESEAIPLLLKNYCNVL